MTSQKRLIDLYDAGNVVQICFAHQDKERWHTATVLRHDPPGIWVQTNDGKAWFVTNTRHIRLAQF